MKIRQIKSEAVRHQARKEVRPKKSELLIPIPNLKDSMTDLPGDLSERKKHYLRAWNYGGKRNS